MEVSMLSKIAPNTIAFICPELESPLELPFLVVPLQTIWSLTQSQGMPCSRYAAAEPLQSTATPANASRGFTDPCNARIQKDAINNIINETKLTGLPFFILAMTKFPLQPYFF
jgi:hypothetical protein